MKPASAHATLRRIFDVILREAESNPALARKLVEATSGAVAAAAAAAAEVPRPAARQGFDASQFHAVNVLRQHGEAALRGKLEQVKAVESLRSVATASGLVLSGGAAKARPSRADLIDAIVAAAKHYDATRTTAAT